MPVLNGTKTPPATPPGAASPAPLQVSSSRRSSNLVKELRLEWGRLRHSPTSDSQVRIWAEQAPALAGLCTLPELEAAYDDAHASRRDELLLALLELAADNQLAARTVLQLNLAAVNAYTHLYRRPLGGEEEAASAAVAALWETIVGFPCDRRRRSVLANLCLDTRNKLHNAVKRLPAREELTAPELLPDRAVAEEAAVDAEVWQFLASAVLDRVISHADAHLLALTYTVGGDGRRMGAAAVGEAVGTTPANVRQRCHRAVTRLTCAVTEHHAEL